MAINDIVFIESDSSVFELTGANGSINDVLFDNSLIDEITGVNGPVKDIIFDPATTNEIPVSGYSRSRVVNS
jgi:hypothetical protein